MRERNRETFKGRSREDIVKKRRKEIQRRINIERGSYRKKFEGEKEIVKERNGEREGVIWMYCSGLERESG